MIHFLCVLVKTFYNLLEPSKVEIKETQMRAPKFNSLISQPWAKPPENSYYGDPRYVEQEQHGLEHIERDKTEEEGVEQVVILGYN
jgi:hypothetical protein